MKWFVRSTLVVAFALLCITVFGIQTANAQSTRSAESITLSPAVLKPDFTTGQRGNGVLTVLNDGSTEYTFLVYARPFSVVGEAYDPNYTVVNERTEAYQWIQFAQSKFILKPGEKAEVAYTVQVPKNAPNGGHYAVIFAETQPPVSATANVARKKRVGSILYMNVGNDPKLEGALLSWDAETWQSSLPVQSSVRLQNTGNTHFQADIAVKYSTLFGRKKLQINQQALVLPGTTRKIPFLWENAPAIGIFKVNGTLKYLDTTEALSTKYIVLIPTKVLYAGILVIIGTIVVLGMRRKRSSTNGRAGRTKRN